MKPVMSTWFNKSDLKASFVVFLVALPLCLGISLASNAPLSSGIIAGIIGGLVVGFLGGSEVSVSGPAAGLTVIVAGGIAKLGGFETLCMATAMAGVIQIILGFARFGYIGNLIPASVIKGMLAAIGILIILKQIPHALGFDKDYFGDESFIENTGSNTFSTLLDVGSYLTSGAVAIAVFAFAILFFWDRLPEALKILKNIPGALVVVFGSVILNQLVLPIFNIQLEAEHLVSIPLNESIFKPLNWSVAFSNLNKDVFVVAVTLAIIGSLETLLSLDASEKIDPLKRTPNSQRELYAQGAGNFLSGILGGLPVTAVIVRTSANVASGAQYRSSAVFHGLWLLILTLSAAPLLNMIPLSALAVVLIFVGFKLTTPKLYKQVFAHGYDQFIPFIITIAAILMTDLLMGVMIGFVFGILFVIKNSIHDSLFMVNEGNHYLIRFNKDVSFLNKPLLKKLLQKIPAQSLVTIDGSRSVYIDHDIVDIIQDYAASGPAKGINVEFKKSSLALNPHFKE